MECYTFGLCGAFATTRLPDPTRSAADVTRILADGDASVMVTIYAVYADILDGIISRIVADDVVA